MPIVEEQIRQIISQNEINSVVDVYTLLRDNFKDIQDFRKMEILKINK